MKIERITHLETLRQRATRTSDGSGRRLDPGILDLVVSLQAHGFTTTASCEGHPDRACGTPWVDLGAKDERPPLFPGSAMAVTFENQAEIFQEVANRIGVPLPEMVHFEKWLLYEDAVREAWSLSEAQPLTPEAARHQQELEASRKSMSGLLEEFGSSTLWMDGAAGSNYRLISGSREDHDSWRLAPPPGLGQRLEKNQQQARDFADFLAQHYLTRD